VSIVVVDRSKNDAHEDVETDDKVSHEIQGKPLALVVSRHPGEQNTYWLVKIHTNNGINMLKIWNTVAVSFLISLTVKPELESYC